MALRHGWRELPGGSSLAKLLAENRGVRNTWTCPDLSVAQILVWVDAHRERTGQWPNLTTGTVFDAPMETWRAIDHALKRGGRGFPGDQSLAKLIAAERGARNQVNVPKLNRKGILNWVDAHHRRTGEWPTQDSGPIHEAPGETWAAVDAALLLGNRGLPGGSSIARLLAECGKKRNQLALPTLSRRKILAWADAHFQAKGEWPNVNSGEIIAAPGERWDLIDNALRQGHRGLAGDSSLLLLLAKKRGVRNPLALPPLSKVEILRLAELHHQRTGSLPKYRSGWIVDAPGESWGAVDWALRHGKRALAGGSSLAKLLAEEEWQ